MHPSCESLIELLHEELSIYAELAGLLEAERAAMHAMALDALTRATAAKDTLLLRIKALDESRKLLAQRLASELGLPRDEVTLTRLAQVAPAPQAAQLRAAGNALRERVEQCQALNRHNALAAERGLDLVNRGIQYLVETADPAGRVYQKSHKPAAYGPQATLKRTGSTPAGFISRQV